MDDFTRKQKQKEQDYFDDLRRTREREHKTFLKDHESRHDENNWFSGYASKDNFKDMLHRQNEAQRASLEESIRQRNNSEIVNVGTKSHPNYTTKDGMSFSKSEDASAHANRHLASQTNEAMKIDMEANAVINRSGVDTTLGAKTMEAQTTQSFKQTDVYNGAKKVHDMVDIGASVTGLKGVRMADEKRASAALYSEAMGTTQSFVKAGDIKKAVGDNTKVLASLKINASTLKPEDIDKILRKGSYKGVNLSSAQIEALTKQKNLLLAQNSASKASFMNNVSGVTKNTFNAIAKNNDVYQGAQYVKSAGKIATTAINGGATLTTKVTGKSMQRLSRTKIAKKSDRLSNAMGRIGDGLNSFSNLSKKDKAKAVLKGVGTGVGKVVTAPAKMTKKIADKTGVSTAISNRVTIVKNGLVNAGNKVANVLMKPINKFNNSKVGRKINEIADKVKTKTKAKSTAKKEKRKAKKKARNEKITKKREKRLHRKRIAGAVIRRLAISGAVIVIVVCILTAGVNGGFSFLGGLFPSSSDPAVDDKRNLIQKTIDNLYLQQRCYAEVLVYGEDDLEEEYKNIPYYQALTPSTYRIIKQGKPDEIRNADEFSINQLRNLVVITSYTSNFERVTEEETVTYTYDWIVKDSDGNETVITLYDDMTSKYIPPTKNNVGYVERTLKEPIIEATEDGINGLKVKTSYPTCYYFEYKGDYYMLPKLSGGSGYSDKANMVGGDSYITLELKKTEHKETNYKFETVERTIYGPANSSLKKDGNFFILGDKETVQGASSHNPKVRFEYVFRDKDGNIISQEEVYKAIIGLTIIGTNDAGYPLESYFMNYANNIFHDTMNNASMSVKYEITRGSDYVKWYDKETRTVDYAGSKKDDHYVLMDFEKILELDVKLDIVVDFDKMAKYADAMDFEWHKTHAVKNGGVCANPWTEDTVPKMLDDNGNRTVNGNDAYEFAYELYEPEDWLELGVSFPGTTASTINVDLKDSYVNEIVANYGTLSDARKKMISKSLRAVGKYQYSVGGGHKTREDCYKTGIDNSGFIALVICDAHPDDVFEDIDPETIQYRYSFTGANPTPGDIVLDPKTKHMAIYLGVFNASDGCGKVAHYAECVNMDGLVGVQITTAARSQIIKQTYTLRAFPF